ncbi:MAG UNVERIFIED_CONTAM: hypothetical protein LVR18_03565 [Planctomycetaceae bacterium]
MVNKNNDAAAFEPLAPDAKCVQKCKISIKSAASHPYPDILKNPTQNGTGTYSFTGPDASGNYKISWTNNNVYGSEWPRSTYLDSSIDYSPGTDSKPTIKLETTNTCRVTGMKIQKYCHCAKCSFSS